LPKSYEDYKLRIKRLWESAKKEGLDGLVVSSPIHIFYLSGTLARGCLIITEDKVQLLVNRPLNRAKREALWQVKELRSLKELPDTLSKLRVKKPGAEGPAFYSLAKYLAVKDITQLLINERKIKTPLEILCHKRAASMLDRALKRALTRLRPDMTELEASAEIEKELRILGHPGITRSFNGFEMNMGHLISGKSGLLPIHVPTGQGGKGVPGFPGGASKCRLKENTPILIDFSGYHHGYYVDQTRMASFKPLKEAEEAYKWALKVIKVLISKVRPGILAEQVFEIACEITSNSPFSEFFMKHGDRPLKFIGHGVGLQIDEPPVLAENQKEELKENMVIALEPKFHIPGLGVIGIEDTFLVTKEGLKRITKTPQKWIKIN
jgi:Xaa-Pro aminopeptidase